MIRYIASPRSQQLSLDPDVPDRVSIND